MKTIHTLTFAALFTAAAAHAQISVNTFDTAFSTFADDGDSTTSTSFSASSSSAGNYFVLGIATESINETTNPIYDLVQFNGSDMDLLGYEANGARKVGIYGIPTTASSGTVDVGISSDWLLSTNGGEQAFSYGFLSGVNTTTPLANSDTATGDGTLSLGPVSDGQLAYTVIAGNNDVTLTISPADTTVVLSQSDNANMGTYTGAFGYDESLATAGSYDVSIGGGVGAGTGVVLNVVPEPSTYAALVGIAVLLGTLVRRRQSRRA